MMLKKPVLALISENKGEISVSVINSC